mmetsp:Transcript_50259/g.141714  ORF Transcript_50259/g.141714 Transcript_50259/m.141714 type:complete len:82 (+) Transcript_50259:274-519(+)
MWAAVRAVRDVEGAGPRAARTKFDPEAKCAHVPRSAMVTVHGLFWPRHATAEDSARLRRSSLQTGDGDHFGRQVLLTGRGA